MPVNPGIFFIYLYMKILFFLFPLICLTPCSGQENILEKALSSEDDAYSYELSEKTKSFFKTDTIKSTLHVYLQKHENDSLYDFRIKGENFSKYRLGDSLYVFFHENKTYYKEKAAYPDNMEILLPFHIFTNQSPLEKGYVVVGETGDEIILRKDFEDQKGFSNIFKAYRVSIPNQQISKITSSVDFNTTNQYKEFSFGRIDHAARVDLKKEIAFYKTHYSYVQFQSTESGGKTFKAFKKAINFEGEILGEREKRDMKSFKDKIIVLDYWFVSCYPCIKSIPFINKLHTTFAGEDLVVLGVNIVDEKKQRIQDFVRNFKVEYPIFLTGKNPYNVKSFPTVIVINKDKEIIYTAEGYNEKRKADLLKIIEEELKR